MRKLILLSFIACSLGVSAQTEPINESQNDNVRRERAKRRTPWITARPDVHDPVIAKGEDDVFISLLLVCV